MDFKFFALYLLVRSKQVKATDMSSITPRFTFPLDQSVEVVIRGNVALSRVRSIRERTALHPSRTQDMKHSDLDSRVDIAKLDVSKCYTALASLLRNLLHSSIILLASSSHHPRLSFVTPFRIHTIQP